MNLSRFDWGGPRVISRFDYGGPRVVEDNQLGYWQVETFKGRYNITFDLPELTQDGIAHLKYGALHVTKAVKKGQTSVSFSNVQLPNAKGNFHAYIKADRLPVGPLFVDVARID